MARYSDTLRQETPTSDGPPIVGALVAVKNQDGTTPVLKADDGTTLFNPLTTDEYGGYYFNVVDGVYDLKYYYGNRLISTRYNLAVGVVGLANGSVADSMGSGTIVAPSQRAVTAAITVVQTQVTTNTTNIATNTAGIATNAAAVATETGRATAAETTLSGRIDGIVATPHSSFASMPLDVSITSSTTLVTDPNLSVPLKANSLVGIRGYINYVTGATGDFKFRLIGPASPIAVQIRRSAIAPGDTSYSAIAVDSAYSGTDISIVGAAGAGSLEFSAVIANGANIGNFGFQWAQNTSDATATTLKAGSYMEYVALPALANFAFANTAIAALGVFTPSTTGGHNLVTAILGAGNSHLETIVTGSKCEVQFFNTGSTPAYTVIVDGGAPFTITPPAGWSFGTLFSGLADGPHTLNITGSFYDTDITLRVSGTQPALTRPSNRPTFYVLGSAPFSTYGAVDAVTNLNTNIYPAPYQRSWAAGAGWGLRFKATTTSVRLWMYNSANPSRMILLQDGVQVGDVTPSGLGTSYEVITLATGLSGSHEYEIKFIEVGRSSFAYGLMVDALDTVSHSAKLIDAHYGDSIAAEVSTAALLTFDGRLGDAYQVASAGGHTSVLRGVGGAKVSTALRDGTATVTAMPVLPNRIFITAGTNDMFAAVNVATFQADYQTMLTNLRTGVPSAKIYARGILNTTRNTPTERNTYNAAIAAAVTAMADANIVYVNTDGWIDPTIGVDTGDGLHPNIAGYAKMATAQLAAL